MTATQVAFSGPLPPPTLLEKYEQICPGAADRILKQWEVQTEHRQGLEDHAIKANTTGATRGQWFAFVISLAVLGVAVWLLTVGKDAAAVITIVTEIVALAGVFITGRRRQNKELAAKRGAVEQAARTVQME